MALNGAIALGVPLVALALRARSRAMPRGRGAAGRARASARGSRELGTGIALPLALQAIYLVCVPLAAREGVGAVTSFGYAYLIAVGGRRA